MTRSDRRPVTRSVGSFGFQPVVGLAAPDPERAIRNETTVMGLPLVGHYLYGAFVTEDGYRAAPQRHIRDEVAVSLFYYEADKPDAVLAHRGSANRAHRGICEVGRDADGRYGWWHPEPDPRFVFVEDTTSARWRDRGFVEAEGTLIGEVMQYAIPDAEEPLVYTSRVYRCPEAVVDGRPARGYFFHDEVYLRQGHSWVASRYLHGLESAWTAFVTEFEDGAVHAGHLIWSNENFRLALIQRTDGPPVLQTAIPGEVELDDQGYYAHARHDLGDDGVWVWRPIHPDGGRMPPSPFEDGPRWREGLVTLEDEKRAVVVNNAWSESYPKFFDPTS
ncbi:hypothetical protein [Cryptosporangium aurantiacum]|uniref:Uncharacterized protein n=1 Tax=Cryptosporangium aurantiacum TaxID=134849 RepID=A0A1M7R4H3_9ACTN|nr:hypothetical protein [Cryptosporangium aurantiacum]SHN40143.1 hypothetical protein SAMN05443668_106439 [Cryptosporangium aurantiacum]